MGLSQGEKTERANVMADVKTFLPRDDKDYFFVSYKSDDWRIALDQVVRKLVNNYGLRVYYDRNFDRDNELWCDNMSDAITNKRCKGVIVFLSTKYLSSYACAMEMMSTRTKITNMRHNNKKLEIIPVIIDEQAESAEQLLEMMTGGSERAEIKEWKTYSDILEQAIDANKAQQSLLDILQYVKELGERVTIDDLANVIMGIVGNDAHFRKYDKNDKTWFDDLVSTIKNITAMVFDDNIKGSCVSKRTAQEIEKIEKEIEEKSEVEKNDIGISKNDVKKATEECIKELSSEGRDVYMISDKGEPHFYTKKMDEYLTNTTNSMSVWKDEKLYRYEIKLDKLENNKLGVRFTPSKVGASQEECEKMIKLHKTMVAQNEGGNYNIKEDFTWGRVISKYEEISEKVSYDELKKIIKNWIIYLLDKEQQIFDELDGKISYTKNNEEDEKEAIRIRYWEKLNEVLKTRSDCKFQVKNVRNHPYCNLTNSLFKGVGVQVNISKSRIYAYIWININNDKDLNQKIFDIVSSRKDVVENILAKYKNDTKYEWKRDKGSDNVSCSVNIIMESADFTNESDWNKQHEFLADSMIALDNELIRANEEELKKLINV